MRAWLLLTRCLRWWRCLRRSALLVWGPHIDRHHDLGAWPENGGDESFPRSSWEPNSVTGPSGPTKPLRAGGSRSLIPHAAPGL